MITKFIDDNLLGQKGLSRYLDPQINWQRDIQEYDIAIYTDQKCFIENIDANKINYAWIIEPPIINGDNHINITKPENYSKFHTVFSCNRWIGEKIPNFKFVAHGGTWLREEDILLHDKNKICSMIFSDKQWNAGHRYRSLVWEKICPNEKVDFFGSGVKKYIEYKITALKDYMFSVCMENEGQHHLFAPNNDYFSEKLLDCILTGTIPIYYGNRNIENYFDIDGMILFDDHEKIIDIIENLDETLYERKKKAAVKNFEIAKKYIYPEHRINKYVQ